MLKYYDGFSFRGHHMIVTELLSQNLYDYSMDPMFIGMPRDLLKSVAGQILNALKHLRDIRIIHGDLKCKFYSFMNVKMHHFNYQILALKFLK